MRALMHALLLAALCAVSMAALPSGTSSTEASQQLEVELRSLQKDMQAYSSHTHSAAMLQHPSKMPNVRSIVSKTIGLMHKMTTGPYKKVAGEIAMRAARKSDALRAVDCTAADKEINDAMGPLTELVMAEMSKTAGNGTATPPDDCSAGSFIALIEIATLESTGLTGDAAAVQKKLAKECSFEGEASATSCGSKSPLAVLSRMSRKWGRQDGMKKCASKEYLAYGMYSDVVCAKEGDKYCLPKLGSVMDMGEMGVPTKESLDSMCDPCVLKVMRVMMRVWMSMMDEMDGGGDSSGFADGMMAMMEAMCSTGDDGTYCMLQAEMLMMMDDSASNEPKMSTVCGTCGLKMQAAAAAFMPAKEKRMMQKMMTAQCFQKEEGVFCGDYIAKSWDKTVKDCGVPEDPVAATLPAAPTCSDTCKPTWNAMSADWGCCLATLGASMETEFTTYLGNMAAACGASLPSACSGGKPLKFKIIVKNLKQAWYTAAPANKDLVTDLVSTDVAGAFGILPGLVSCSGEKMAEGDGTKVTINLEFSSTAQAAATKAKFEETYKKTRRAGVKLSFDSLELLPADAKVDPTATMSVEVEPTIEAGASTVINPSSTPASSPLAFVNLLLGAVAVMALSRRT